MTYLCAQHVIYANSIGVVLVLWFSLADNHFTGRGYAVVVSHTDNLAIYLELAREVGSSQWYDLRTEMTIEFEDRARIGLGKVNDLGFIVRLEYVGLGAEPVQGVMDSLHMLRRTMLRARSCLAATCCVSACCSLGVLPALETLCAWWRLPRELPSSRACLARRREAIGASRLWDIL